VGRSTWLVAGVAVGIGGTLWAEQRVRRTVAQAVDRLTPEHLAGEAISSVKAAGNRVRAAVDVGRDEKGRHEEQLWAEYDARQRGDVQPGGHEFTVTRTHISAPSTSPSGPARRRGIPARRRNETTVARRSPQ
jgi:hypothetical protein